MKLKFLIVCSMMFNIAFASNSIKWVDRIVIVVNNDVITERDLSDMMFNIEKQVPKNKKLDPKDLKTAAMQRLLEEKLLIQLAQNRDITTSDEEIDDQVENIAHARKISVAKVYELIDEEGVDKQSLRNTISNNIIIDKVLNQLLPATTPATADEINTLLIQNHIPINAENEEQAAIFIRKQKSQQSYVNLIEQLRSAAYIKVNDQPY